MKKAEKATLVARVLQRGANDPDAEWGGMHGSMAGLCHRVRKEKYTNGEDRLWLRENWEQTFLRYVRRGHITREQIDEFYCRIVLEGLHNEVGESNYGYDKI